MAKMYVANLTKQVNIFCFYLPEVNKLQEMEIRGGTQISIEASPEALAKIIASHRKYGLVSVADAAKDKQFSGLCYQMESVINIDHLGEVKERREEYEDARSNTMRTVAAHAVHQKINEAARETGLDAVKTVVQIEERRSPEMNAAATRPAVRQMFSSDDAAGQRATS